MYINITTIKMFVNGSRFLNIENMYSGNASNSSTDDYRISVNQCLFNSVIKDQMKINEDLRQSWRENNLENDNISKSTNQDLFNSGNYVLNKPLKSPTDENFTLMNEKLNEFNYENSVTINANHSLKKCTEQDLNKLVNNNFISLNEKRHSVKNDASKVVNEEAKLSSDEGLHSNNKYKEVSETNDCTSKCQNVSTPVYQDFMSNNIKELWLKSTLSFIKNDKKESLRYPKIPLTEAVFIEAVIDQNFKPDLNNDFKTLYMSIREAMTIFKNKYDFLLKTVSKTKKSVHFCLEKIPRNDNASLKNTHNHTEKRQLSEKKLKKRNKKILDKLAIIATVSMPFVLDCMHKILAFIEDSMSASIVFKKLSPKEWTFMMNIKAIVKIRHMLVNDIPSELHKLLNCIGAHKDYGFNLALIGQDKTSKDRSVTLMKTPMFTMCNKNNHEDEQTSLISKLNEKGKGQTPVDNDPSSVLLKAITKPLKDLSSSETSIEIVEEASLRSRPTSSERSSPDIKSEEDHITEELKMNTQVDMELCSSTVKCSNSSDEQSLSPEKKAVHCPRDDTPASENQKKSSAVKSYHTSIERMPAAKPKTTVQFQLGGDSDATNVDSPRPKTIKMEDECFRGRSLDRRTDQMKNKLYEGLSIPLECEKAKRMMKLMGWNGGGLGTRGEGITEPIMPALGIVTGAGLGHVSTEKKNIINNVPKKPRTQLRPNNFYYGQYDEMAMCNPALAPWKLNKDVETRVYILSNILEFVLSDEKQKVLMFDIPLIYNESNFLTPVIRSLNDGTNIALQSDFECGLFYKIQDVMVSKPELTLGAYLTSHGKTIQLLKLNENVVPNPEGDECYKKNISLDEYITHMRPMETYGSMSKKAFRLFAFRLMMLDEILKFLESNEITIIYNIVTLLYKKHMKFLSCFIDNVNIRRRDKSLTPDEDLIAKHIYNKLGDDYCICLNIMRRHKQIKLQKKSRKVRDSRTLKIYGLDKAMDLSDTKENKEDKLIDGVQSVAKGENQKNLLESRKERVDSENYKHGEDNQPTENTLQSEKELDAASQIVVKEGYEICKRQQDLTEESTNLLKDIEELEKSISKGDHPNETDLIKYETNSESNFKLNPESIKTNEFNIYKCISITCKDPNEKLTINSVRTIQNLISNAIDNSDSFLPLLQCNGMVDDKLSYSCYNEQTYLWIRTVIGDNYLTIDNTITKEDQYKMQIKLRTFIDDISERTLNRIKLYNPELNVGSWKLESKVVSIDFTLLEVQVDVDSFHFISRHNFSLFAGVDRAQFSVILN